MKIRAVVIEEHEVPVTYVNAEDIVDLMTMLLGGDNLLDTTPEEKSNAVNVGLLLLGKLKNLQGERNGKILWR